MDDKWVMIDFGGARKTILKSKLPQAQQHAKEIQQAAIRGGYTKERAEKEFYFKIVKEDE